MLKKRILGIILAILGVSLLISSFYIKSQISSGREEISDAEKKLNIGKKLFSLNPITKEAGKDLSAPIERKIEAGSEKANRYEMIATRQPRRYSGHSFQNQKSS